MKAFFCLLVVLLAVVSAQDYYTYGNCNHGLVDGVYYCYQNEVVPFTLTVGPQNDIHGHENDIIIQARAFGCVEPIYGHYSIFAEYLTFQFVEGCENFNGIFYQETFVSTFSNTCYQFKGVNDEGNEISCILSQYDPAYIVYEEPNTASTMTVGIMSLVAFLALFF